MTRFARAMDSTPIPSGESYHLALKWAVDSPPGCSSASEATQIPATVGGQTWSSPPVSMSGMADYMGLSPPSLTPVAEVFSGLAITKDPGLGNLGVSGSELQPIHMIGTDNGHLTLMDQPLHNFDSWQAPWSSPSGLLETDQQDYFNVKNDVNLAPWTLNSPPFRMRQSSTLSLAESSVSFSSSCLSSSDGQSSWGLMTPSEPANGSNVPMFDFEGSPFDSGAGLPAVPVVPSQIQQATDWLNDSSSLPALVGREMSMSQQPEQEMFTHESSFVLSSSPTHVVTKAPRGRARRSQTRNNRSRRPTRTAGSRTTRNAVTVRNGAYVMSDPRGDNDVPIVNHGNGRWTTPQPRHDLHYCDVSDDETRCTASFKRKEHLTRHALKHSGLCKWPCPLEEQPRSSRYATPCKKRCSRHDNLMDHVSKHCRAWLAKEYPDYGLKTRSHPVSVERAEQLIIEDQCGQGGDLDEDQLRAVKVKLWQLVGRLRKDFPYVPDEVLLFPLLRED
ncbi:hypothetical protein ANO11243_044150 [Dothideomycetidae sp. 11243]|nr:hypothetical protein ANO11243_044150 [fungal sp. No.11243]